MNASLVQSLLAESNSHLNALSHATKLPALKQLLNECGIGTNDNDQDCSRLVSIF